ncbi:Protein of unknown function [Gryllus bimaculatus]|nr:Protein of unknown function [Gryllus bimaculatus]
MVRGKEEDESLLFVVGASGSVVKVEMASSSSHACEEGRRSKPSLLCAGRSLLSSDVEMECVAVRVRNRFVVKISNRIRGGIGMMNAVDVAALQDQSTLLLRREGVRGRGAEREDKSSLLQPQATTIAKCAL